MRLAWVAEAASQLMKCLNLLLPTKSTITDVPGPGETRAG